MRIAICDDSKTDAVLLDAMVKSFFAEDQGVFVQTFDSGEAFIRNCTKSGMQYDLVFLDMHMGGMSGMDVAKAIRERDGLCYIVFITVASEFAADGYQVNAYRYLEKPVRQETIRRVLEELTKALLVRERTVSVETSFGAYRIPVNRIMYIQKNGKKVFFHLSDGQVLETPVSLRTITDELKDVEYFFRPHRSYVVNMLFVKFVDRRTKKAELKNGEALSIPRENFGEFIKTFMRITGDRKNA